MSEKNASAQLEDRRFELEAEIRRREISLKESQAKRGGLTSAQATIAGALLALISGVVGALITAWSSQSIESGKSLTLLQIEERKVKGNLQLEESKQLATEALERKKFETSLILEAIKTPSRSDAIRNLKFFVAAGFVSDPDGKIAALRDESLPSISEPSRESATRALEATGLILASFSNSGDRQCTGVAVSPQHVVTASFCVQEISDQTIARDISFVVGENEIPLRVVSQEAQTSLALLQTDSPARLEDFLDRSRTRKPRTGERVYLAFMSADGKGSSSELRTCEIAEDASSDVDFLHNCDTGPGSAGAIVIAVTDDALLGVHHSANPSRDLGVAAKLSEALTDLIANLSTTDPDTRQSDR